MVEFFCVQKTGGNLPGCHSKASTRRGKMGKSDYMKIITVNMIAEHLKKKKKVSRSSCCGTAETNPTGNQEVSGSIPGLAEGVKDPALP